MQIGLLKKRLANETNEEAPQQTFKKTYLVAFLSHSDATEPTFKMWLK